MAVNNTFLYGYSADSPFFQGKPIKERVNILKKQGIGGVFGGYEDRDFVEEMHEQEMKVFASFKCFAGDKEWDTIPGCHPIKANGSPLEKIDWYCGLNPANGELRKARLDSLEELLTEKKPDGIWFDFIRWPCKWEKSEPLLSETSFNRETVEQFETKFNLTLKSDSPASWSREILGNYEKKWRVFRASLITLWLEKATALIKSKSPEIPIGCFTVPWIENEHNNGLYNILGQDIAGMSQHIDYFSPMVYHGLCHRNREWIKEICDWYGTQTRKPLWPIIQSVNSPPGFMDTEKYDSLLEYAREKVKSPGLIIFSLDGHFSLK